MATRKEGQLKTAYCIYAFNPSTPSHSNSYQQKGRELCGYLTSRVPDIHTQTASRSSKVTSYSNPLSSTMPEGHMGEGKRTKYSSRTFFNVGNTRSWVYRFTPQPLYPGENVLGMYIINSWVGFAGFVYEETNFLPVSSIAKWFIGHYSNWAIPVTFKDAVLGRTVSPSFCITNDSGMSATAVHRRLHDICQILPYLKTFCPAPFTSIR
jgi:hypothetical protein